MKKSAVTVRFPAPLPAEIPCPVCRVEQGKKGGGCKVCDFTGKLNITVDAKIPIHRGHIIEYVSKNLHTVASELTRVSGLVPEVETLEVIESEVGQFEIVQISSLGGAVWIANRLDDFAAPRYIYNLKELNEFKKGIIHER
tara:strand:+ start:480 stop:902 length:423 start_codon:yes stop_codon:yes gene_type:complete